jgi:hypothetical protein
MTLPAWSRVYQQTDCVPAVSLQSYTSKNGRSAQMITQQPLAGPPECSEAQQQAAGAGSGAGAGAASAAASAFAKAPNSGVGDVVMGCIGHAVVVAGGWCRLSSNYATPSHLLDRMLHYKAALMEELRAVGEGQHQGTFSGTWSMQPTHGYRYTRLCNGRDVIRCHHCAAYSSEAGHIGRDLVKSGGCHHHNCTLLWQLEL